MKPLTSFSRFFLPSLCAAFMIGIGLRFIFDGFFNNNIYKTNIFDVFFDWGLLTILGILLFIYSIYCTLKQQQGVSSE
jgi:hypothetical protein